MKNLLKMGALVSVILLCFTACKWDKPKTQESCPPPTNLMVDSVGSNNIKINWTLPFGVDSFQVTITPQPPGNPGPFITSDTSFNITGLVPNTEYTIEVRSICDGHLSAPATVNARTSSIIIIDVISQLSAPQQQIIGKICKNGETISGAFSWNDSHEYEMLHFEAKMSNQVIANICILKHFVTQDDKIYFSIPPEGEVSCGNNVLFNILSAPPVVSTMSNTAILSGTASGYDYNIDISNTGAVITFQNSSVIVSRTIYR